jgi:hypothetical protein
VWRETSTGRQGRTSTASLKLPHTGRLCVQVTLLRAAGATTAQSTPSSPVCAG